MKRILSLLLTASIILAALTMLCGLSAGAEGEALQATVWTPVEISLTSSVDYKNPYTSTEIDATFTHADGTVIALPGFWKQGDTWAVRFSPTKAGEWTYKITCADAGNAGLNASGTINATAAESDNPLVKHGFVRVSDNGRYYTYDDGTPFFWLGDTNWQAPNYVSTTACNYPGCSCGSQFKHEVDNRASKGFTVYQTYFDTAVSDGGGQRDNAKSIWTTKFTKPSVNVFNNKIDGMFEYLYQKGMVIALGLGVHSSTANNISEKDFLRFTRYIVARYACYSVVWISGQEITNTDIAKATPSKDVMSVYMNASALIEELDGYRHPNGAHMYPMRSTDERAKRLDAASWHDVWILQGGHGGSAQSKAFYKSYYYNSSGTVKPFIEGEANYEEINCGGFTGYNASRHCAWKSMLCGCAGFTYGVTGIWANCYSNSGNTGWYGITSYSYEPWFIGLNKPGSYEVGYMRSFFEGLTDWYNLVPRYSDNEYSSFGDSETKVLASTEDSSTYVAYFYNSTRKTGTIYKLDSGKTYHIYWFNPLTGEYISLGDKSGITELELDDKPTSDDWVLLVTSVGENVSGIKAVKEAYTDLPAAEITGNAVTPASVTAIGGCYYEGSKLIDNTSKLYDGNADTCWSPLADRTTQTIIYDLGEQHDVTHITITPEAGTTLPKYRIEGSVDGVAWRIIANASARDARWVDGSISEPLAGQYRYIKVLLLNAEDVSENSEYKLTYNSATNSYYSHTSISEITVYSNGKTVIPTATADTASSGAASSADTAVTAEVTAASGLPAVAVAAVCVAATAVLVFGGLIAYTLLKKKEPAEEKINNKQ